MQILLFHFFFLCLEGLCWMANGLSGLCRFQPELGCAFGSHFYCSFFLLPFTHKTEIEKNKLNSEFFSIFFFLHIFSAEQTAKFIRIGSDIDDHNDWMARTRKFKRCHYGLSRVLYSSESNVLRNHTQWNGRRRIDYLRSERFEWVLNLGSANADHQQRVY